MEIGYVSVHTSLLKEILNECADEGIVADARRVSDEIKKRKMSQKFYEVKDVEKNLEKIPLAIQSLDKENIHVHLCGAFRNQCVDTIYRTFKNHNYEVSIDEEATLSLPFNMIADL